MNQNFKLFFLKREKVKNKEGKSGTQIWESRSKNEDTKMNIKAKMEL